MADAFDGGEEPEPLILTKKITLEAGGHGGAWKVAYADFVTAMMAFFLLLWLLNATTEEQVNGLSDYFAPSNIAESEAGLGEALSGLSAAAEKSLRSDSARPSVSVAMPSFGGEAAGEERGEERESETETKVKEAKASEQEAETERLNDAMEKLRQSISETPETADLQENLLIDQTKDGLRIQILDKAGKGMFEQGTADLTRRAIRLLALIGSVTADLPNEIAITGHTDTTPPPGDGPTASGNCRVIARPPRAAGSSTPACRASASCVWRARRTPSP